MKGIDTPKNPITKEMRYTKKIPPVAAASPSLKFSVARISPLR